MENLLTMQKAERLAKTKGLRGWAAMLGLLAVMCADQFIMDIPFENVVFPILIICAASMNIGKNFVLVTAYSLLFELSCIAWFPADLMRVNWWLLEVWIGYSMPYLIYKAVNFKHKNMSVFSYAALAATSQLLYFWVSVVATVILWGVTSAAYI